MPGAGVFAHAETGLSDTSILALGCNDKGPRARGKKSTAFVDNFAEKFSGGTIFPCFLRPSTVCLFFRHICKPLKTMERFSTIGQIPDKSEDFVTA
jgi:hypothetical protein